ncbi:MAG: hypothetical protein R3B56_16165 [Candidatus Scalinduaceae bacterium]
MINPSVMISRFCNVLKKYYVSWYGICLKDLHLDQEDDKETVMRY